MKSLNLCCYLHMYPPIHCAGSEVTVHAAMRELVKRGHRVTVIADRTPEDYEYEGVHVKCLPQNQLHHVRVREIAADADLLVTHLDCTSLAMTLSIDLQKPLVHFVHNHAQLAYWNTPPHKAQLVVFNSHWVAKNETYKGEPWPGKPPIDGWKPEPQSIVIHPVIEPEKYKCERGAKITFCNPTTGKGVETVHKLAESMPDYEFLIVEGIYGEQVAPPNLNEGWEAAHPNITHVKNDPDFRNILRETKVLLMPSLYESYGRCAVEAACAGIPSIVHPTQGLWEALGDGRQYPALRAQYGVEGSVVTSQEDLPEGMFDGGLVNGAGIFCTRDDVHSWKKQIERLYSDEVYYRGRVDAAHRLVSNFNPQKDFDRLEKALLNTFELWQKKDEVKNMPTWISDRVLWETSDGRLIPEVNKRIPADAIRQAAGIGTPIDEEVAIKNGLIPAGEVKDELKEEIAEEKAIDAPAENKALKAPKENKGVKVVKKRAKKIA